MGQDASVMQPEELSAADKAGVWGSKKADTKSRRNVSETLEWLEGDPVTVVSKLIASGKAKRIVVAAGAGMSVAAGTPWGSSVSLNAMQRKVNTAEKASNQSTFFIYLHTHRVHLLPTSRPLLKPLAWQTVDVNLGRHS